MHASVPPTGRPLGTRVSHLLCCSPLPQVASREYGRFVSATMGLLEAFAVQLFVCEVFKLYAGRPRFVP